MHLLITTGQPSPPTTKIMIKIQPTVVPLLLVDQTGINTVTPHSYLLHFQPIHQTVGVSKISFLFSPLPPNNLLYVHASADKSSSPEVYCDRLPVS